MLRRYLLLPLLAVLWALKLPLTAQTLPNTLFNLDLSPDGTKIAGSDLNGTIKIWDANNMILLMEFDQTPQILDDFSFDIAWKPNSQWLATGDNKGILRIWNVSDSQYAIGQLIRTIDTHMGTLASLDWHSDGLKLAVASRAEMDANYPTLGVWNTNDGSLISQVEWGDLKSIDWKPNTDTFAIGNANAGVEFLPFTLSQEALANSEFILGMPVGPLAWNSDGTRLAVGENFTGRIWILDQNGTTVRTIEAHANKIHSLAWSPDNTRLASTGDDNLIKIWNASTGELITSRQMNRQSYINSFDWTLDGTQILFADTGLTPILALASDLSIEVTPTSPTATFTPTPTSTNTATSTFTPTPNP